MTEARISGIRASKNGRRLDRTGYGLQFFVCLVDGYLLTSFFDLGARLPSADHNGVGASFGVALAFIVAIVAMYWWVIFTIRRLHDLDETGWKTLLLFVPVYGIGFQMLLLLRKGTEGSNRYGPATEGQYLRKPETLRKIWLWWVVLCGAGFPLAFFFIGLLLIIPALFMGLVMFYRFWHIIQCNTPRTTPGKAVGYPFIPVYGLYWLYVACVGLAKDTNSYCRHKSITGRVNEGIALTYYILLLVQVAGAAITCLAVAWGSEAAFVAMYPVIFVVGAGTIVVGAILVKQLVETAVRIIESRSGEQASDDCLPDR